MDDACWVVKNEVGSSSLGKTLHTSFGKLALQLPQLQMLFGKVVFIKCLCCDSALHARPLE